MFAKTVARIEASLARDRLNTTHQHLAYRARRARELLARKNPLIVAGTQLEPMFWRGKPGRADLSKAIMSVNSTADFGLIKKLIRDYQTYSPAALKPFHLSLVLRRLSALGLFNEARTFVTSSGLSELYTTEPKLEALKTYALRLAYASPEGKSKDYAAKLTKLVNDVGSQGGLEAQLLELVGLANLSKRINDASQLVESRAKDLSGPLEAGAASELVDLASDMSRQASLYITFRLALDTQALDVASASALRAAIDALAAKFKHTGFYESYVQTLSSGFAKELTQTN